MRRTLPPPAASGFQGFRVNEAQDAALDAAAPAVTAVQSLKQMGLDEERKQQAIGYQKLLRSGVDGMRQYVQEVQGQYPEVGQQLAQEAEQYAVFFQDPALTGDKAEQYASHFYESANNRIKAIKEAKAAAAPKAWVPTSKEEHQENYKFEQDNKVFAPDSPGGSTADIARREKRMGALRQIPSIWAQLEELQTLATEVPLKPGTTEPDPAKLYASMDEVSQKKWDMLRKQLTTLESEAGLEASKDVIGPGRDSSASYKLFTASRSKDEKAGGFTIQPKTPKAESGNEAALAWLKSPESKKSPFRAQVLAELKKSGADTSGL